MGEIRGDKLATYLTEINTRSAALQKKGLTFEDAFREFNLLNRALDKLPEVHKSSTLPKIAQKLQERRVNPSQKESKTLAPIFEKVYTQAKDRVQTGKELETAKNVLEHLILYDRAHRKESQKLLLQIEAKKAYGKEDQATVMWGKALKSVEVPYAKELVIAARNEALEKRKNKDHAKKAQDDFELMVLTEKSAFETLKECVDPQGTIVPLELDIKVFINYIINNPECHKRLESISSEDEQSAAASLVRALIAYTGTEDKALEPLAVMALSLIEKEEKSGAKDTITFSPSFKTYFKELLLAEKNPDDAVQLAMWALDIQTSGKARKSYEKKSIQLLQKAWERPKEVTADQQRDIQRFLQYAVDNPKLYGWLHAEDVVREKARTKAAEAADKKKEPHPPLTETTREATVAENVVMSFANRGGKVLAGEKKGVFDRLDQGILSLAPILGQIPELRDQEDSLAIKKSCKDMAEEVEGIRNGIKKLEFGQNSRKLKFFLLLAYGEDPPLLTAQRLYAVSLYKGPSASGGLKNRKNYF